MRLNNLSEVAYSARTYIRDGMMQDEKWMNKYKEVVDFIETNHRNPSKHDPEERYRYINWLKQQRKLLNAGALKEDRVEAFKALLGHVERYKRINQYQ